MDVSQLIARHATLAAIALCSSCAIVEIHSNDGADVRIDRHLGIVSISVDPARGPAYLDSHVFGVMNSFEGFAAGYRRASFLFAAPGSCQLTLWIKSDEQLVLLDDFLARHSDVCRVNASLHRGEKP